MSQTIRLCLTHPRWSIDEPLDAEAACELLAHLYLQSRQVKDRNTKTQTKDGVSSGTRTEGTPSLTFPQKIALCAAALHAAGMERFTLAQLKPALTERGYASRNIPRDVQRAVASGLLAKATDQKRAFLLTEAGHQEAATLAKGT
jgi:hypothetical protein